jgi:hypothetical protein
MTKILRVIVAGLALVRLAATAEEAWPGALARMPLPSNPGQLNWTNCPQVVLGAFQSNATVKALIFAPGATDELYFFRRVVVSLTNTAPSLLDAVVALTNQSPLRVTFRAPFLVIYSDEDVLDLDVTIQHPRTVEKLKARKPLPRILVIDRDWNQLLDVIRNGVGTTLQPYRGSIHSWHFYRHTFAGWNLSPWETLEASALAGKTKFTVLRGTAVFEVDPRIGVLPKLDHYPKR